MDAGPLVSVIILSWNAKTYLRECLRSVIASDYPRVEVIVSDNGSSDGSQDMVRESFPGVTLVENGRNLGYSEGNNVAIQRASGDLIVLLNQDTYVSSNYLAEVVRTVGKGGAGIVGCKLMYPGTDVIQSAGFVLHGAGYPFPRMVLQRDRSRSAREEPTDYVSGAALAATRKVFARVGTLDSGFRAYYEDVDFCQRAKRAGFGLAIASDARVYHHESLSFVARSHRRTLLLERGRLRFLFKNFGLAKILLALTVYDAHYALSKTTSFMGGRLPFQLEAGLPTRRSGGKRQLSVAMDWVSTKLEAYFLFLLEDAGSAMRARSLPERRPGGGS